jgi:Dolichyl-phosphate-mannose-protein mannosyltransferase
VTAGTIAPPITQRCRAPRARMPAIRKVLAAVPLLLILTMQVVLTVRLMPYVGSDHDDETIYIYGGHQLIYELLHGGGSPFYETWYSGAPVLYPVLAAVVDHFGGLAAARGMSMVFMLCATALLFLTARRLFGYWVGVTAAALFAGLGVTQNLGALATVDAMSLVLLAGAAYCAAQSVSGTRWLLLVPAFLLAANATKYVTVVFDPVVIGLAAFQLTPEGWSRVWRRILALGSATLAATIVAVFLAGGAYVKGILFTTLARKGGTQVIFGAHFVSSARIISDTWEWMGAVLALGILALPILCLHRSEIRRHGLLLILLITAGMIVTLGNIRLRTDQSMDKHDDFGVWFACIAAAYALAHAADAVRRWRAKIPVLSIAAAAAGCCCYYYSQPASFSSYFRTTPMATYQAETYSYLAPYLKPGNNEYLLASMDDFAMVYDNHLRLHWWQFFDDTYVKYPIPGRGGDAHDLVQGVACGGAGLPPATDPRCMYLEGSAGYLAAIRAHWFALVTLARDHGLSNDKVILAAVRSTPGYVQIFDRGGAPTFIYAPDYPAWKQLNHRPARSGLRPPGRAGRSVSVPGHRQIHAPVLLARLARQSRMLIVWRRTREAARSAFLKVCATLVQLLRTNVAQSSTGGWGGWPGGWGGWPGGWAGGCGQAAWWRSGGPS